METKKTEDEEESQYRQMEFPAYYVSSLSLNPNSADQKDPMVLVALDVYVSNEVDGSSNIVWFDTIRQCGFKATDLTIDSEGVIRFSALQNGFNYSLTPMTVELYNQHVRPFMADSREYSSEQDLLNDLLATKTKNGSW